MKTHLRRIAVNMLTLGRLPLVLLFTIFAVLHVACVNPQNIANDCAFSLIAAICLILASLTDLFDGHLARKWKVVSKFGAMADPLMDKVFYLFVFPTLLWIVSHDNNAILHSSILLSLTILYLLRDQWVTFLRSVASLYNAYCGAMFIGKLRTATTFPAAIFIYLQQTFHFDFIPGWSVFAVEGYLILITIWSLVSYTIAYLPYMRLAIQNKEP